MARATLGTLLLASILATSAADDIMHRIADLKRELKEYNNELKGIDAERELLAQTSKTYPDSYKTPSLYGDQVVPFKTRKYTYEENKTGAMDFVMLILCGACVMFMQAGFAMVEAGNCRVRNVAGNLMKNLTCMSVTCFGWWFLGYSFAYSGPYVRDGEYVGPSPGPMTLGARKEYYFAGREKFFGHMFIEERGDHQLEPTKDICWWFFSWTLCAVSTTIVGGGVAERCTVLGYAVFAFCYSSVVYPIIVAWTWGKGWLFDMNTPGYTDFAGGGIVHMTGGVAALCGAIIAGPRKDRWQGLSTPKQRFAEMPAGFNPHSQPLTALGTFILWFGWYGINVGSMFMRQMEQQMIAEKAFLAAQVAMNTTISAASSGLLVFLMRYAMTKKYDLGGMCFGILAGLVSISAGCGNVESGTACLIGLVGGMLYQIGSVVLRVAKVDDPMDSFPIFGLCGTWAVFAAAAFDWGRGLSHAHGMLGFRCMGWQKTTLGCENDGTDKQGGNLFAANFAEIFGIIAWSGALSIIVFVTLKFSKQMEEDIPEPFKADYSLRSI